MTAQATGLSTVNLARGSYGPHEHVEPFRRHHRELNTECGIPFLDLTPHLRENACDRPMLYIIERIRTSRRADAVSPRRPSGSSCGSGGRRRGRGRPTASRTLEIVSER